MRGVFVLTALLVAGPVCAQPAAAPPPAPTADDCLVCHGDPGAARGDGRSVALDAGRFAASVHGQLGLSCVDCHADLAAAELPHAETLARVDCSTCHDTAAAAYAKSVHAAAQAAGRADAATCASCHTAHEILPAKDPNSTTYHLNLPQTCGKCHGAQAQAAKVPGGDVLAQFQDSIHGKALSRSGLLVAPSCASCHGAHDILARSAAESRVNRGNVPRTCGTCHEGVERVFLASIHGQEFTKGNARAPVCVTCHSAHGVQGVDLAAFRLKVVDTACGECHEESLQTYRDTFHGQVTELGFAAVATCADCHSAHAQFPARDPRSNVSDANRQKTCQRCHADANANFARYDPHANAHDHERGPLLYYSARFMELLLVGVFGFFGVHTTLWFARSYKELRRRRGVTDETGDA
jgi:hypothetical protein